jgi:hypothetical protein
MQQRGSRSVLAKTQTAPTQHYCAICFLASGAQLAPASIPKVKNRPNLQFHTLPVI